MTENRWAAFSDGELLELLMNLRSADEAIDFHRSEALLQEVIAEIHRRDLAEKIR